MTKKLGVCEGEKVNDMILNLTESSHLEQQWETGAKSAVERLALVCRAITELPKKDHMKWSMRIYDCFEDLNLKGDPLIEDKKRVEDANEYRDSHLMQILMNRLISLLKEHASMDALISILSSGQIGEPSGFVSIKPERMLGDLFENALERLVIEKRFKDINFLLNKGAKLKWNDLDFFLNHHNGDAFYFESIAEAASQLLKERYKERISKNEKSSYKKLMSSHSYGQVFFTNTNRVWRDIVSHAFDEGGSFEDQMNEILSCRHRALKLTRLTQDYVENINNITISTKRYKKLTPLTSQEIKAAQDFECILNKYWFKVGKEMMESNPIKLAKYLIKDVHLEKAQIHIWKEFGLSKVNANDFLGGSSTLKEDVFKKFENKTLSHFDCLVTQGTSVENLMFHLECGSMPSEDLIDLLNFDFGYKEKDVLWLISVCAKQAPLKSGSLRI